MNVLVGRGRMMNVGQDNKGRREGGKEGGREGRKEGGGEEDNRLFTCM